MRCKLGEDRKPQYCSDAPWPYQYPSVSELDPFTVFKCSGAELCKALAL